MRGVPSDLLPGDPLCCPRMAVLLEATVHLLRRLHHTEAWTPHINQYMTRRLELISVVMREGSQHTQGALLHTHTISHLTRICTHQTLSNTDVNHQTLILAIICRQPPSFTVKYQINSNINFEMSIFVISVDSEMPTHHDLPSNTNLTLTLAFKCSFVISVGSQSLATIIYHQMLPFASNTNICH